MNGVYSSPSHIRDFDFTICCENCAEIPDEYEVPRENLPPIYDQGNTSKCVAYTMCECVESELIKTNKWVRLSPSWVYGRDEGRNGFKEEGMYMNTALSGILKIGFVPHMYFEFDDLDVPNILDIAKEREDLVDIGKKIKPSSYASIPMYASKDKKWETLKRAIYLTKSPIVAARRGHAIMIYGYTEKDGVRKFKYQNSWGENWGNGGRSEIKLDSIVEAYVLFWNEQQIPFLDVHKNDWFYDDVKNAYMSGLVLGVEPDKFKPHSNLIRGDISIILSRLMDKFCGYVNSFLKSKEQDGYDVSYISFEHNKDILFSDVEENDYYYDHINNVCSNGFMVGKDVLRFCPKEDITRAEVATIICRVVDNFIAKINGAGVGVCSVDKTDMCVKFNDVDDYSWYSPYVRQAIEYGVMYGNGDGTFSPDEKIIRAEASAIFNRLFRLIDKLLEQIA